MPSSTHRDSRSIAALTLPSIFLGLLLSLVLPAPAHAQLGELDVRFGVKAGMGAATMTGDYVRLTGSGAGLFSTETRSRIGFAVGGSMIVGFGQPIFLQPELLYVQKGHRLDISGLGSATFKANSSYLEIPILARYEIQVDERSVETSLLPYVVAGPTIGIALNANSEAEGAGGRVEGTFGEDISSTDFGLAAGAGMGYQLSAGTATLELRYTLGLTNVVPGTGYSARNHSLRLTAGLLF